MTVMQHATTPIFVLGNSRRAEIARAIENCVRGWRDRWSNVGGQIDVDVQDAQKDRLDVRWGSEGSTVVVRSASHGTLLYLDVPNKLIPLLVSKAGKKGITATTGDGAIQSKLLTEVLRSLCSDLLVLARVDDSSIEARTGGEAALPRGARVSVWKQISVHIAGLAVLRMLAHVSLLEALCPSRVDSHKGEPLEPRRHAISEEVVRVEAWLGEAEVGLQELTQLSCGDVLVLKQSLSDPGYLATDKGDRVANIVLGCAGARRAVGVSR